MDELIIELKEKLSHYKTEEILGYVANDFLYTPFGVNSIHEKTNLDSPAKQLTYLIGLLMSTEYVDNQDYREDREFKNDDLKEYKKEIDNLYKTVQKITFKYLDYFFPKDSIENYDEEWKKRREAMLPVFLSYFNNITLCSEEQIIKRIHNWFSRFDNKLKENYNFDTKMLIEFYKFVKNKLENVFNNFQEVVKKCQDELLKLEDEFQRDMNYTRDKESSNWNFEELFRKHPNFEKTKNQFLEMAKEAQELFIIKKQDIENVFGKENAMLFEDLFVLERTNREFKYYTESNPVFEKPLCKMDDDRYFLIQPRFLLDAIYNLCYSKLEELHRENKLNFYKVRGEVVEKEVLNLFNQIFKDKAIYYTSVCETPNENEHDIIILYKENILIIEIKSSKTKEPLRNPDKGFERMKEHFNSETGIGGGFIQANHLKKYILENEEVTLYNNKVEPFKISRKDYKNIFCIVITAEQFFSLNVNTSMFIEKDDRDEYPWTCDLYNLEVLIEGFQYCNKTIDDFIDYIKQRIRYHKKFITDDELEIAEYFLTKGDFSDEIIRKSIFIGFLPTTSNLFDKIYMEKKGIPYNYNSEEQSLFFIMPSGKIGRNDKCPCGSGKKYKKCCGQY